MNYIIKYGGATLNISEKSFMKNFVIVVVSSIGAILSHFFGVWDRLIEAMIVFMVIDMLTGSIVAGIFNKSKKSPDGKLLGKSMAQGMAKKGMALFFVIIGCQFDLLLQRDYVRSAVIFCILTSELLSILENAALMGVKPPKIFQHILSVVSEKVNFDVANKMSKDVSETILGKEKKGGENKS